MEETKKNHWKTVAIVFIILFAIETSFFIWSYKITITEERAIMECYYDICKDYPEAVKEGDLCSCYDYDLLGEYVIAKQELMD